MQAIPVVLLAFSTVATLRASAQTAQAQLNQGAAAQQAAEFNAQQIEKEGDFEERRIRDNTEILKSRQRAILAARGIDLASDSALDVVADTVRIGEEDALSSRYSKQQRAAITRFEGREAQAGAKTASKSTLLTGAGQAISYASQGYQAAPTMKQLRKSL